MNVSVRLQGIVGGSVARKCVCANGGDVAHASPEWTNTGVDREGVCVRAPYAKVHAKGGDVAHMPPE
jgi:hypothetical protein